MINASEAREDDESFENPIDKLFKELEQENPEHFAVRQYKKYKLAAGKTAKSILISCGARLAPFDIAELRELTEDDELELDTLGDKKTALFVIISDTDDTFNFIVAIMYTQLFNDLLDDVMWDIYDYAISEKCERPADVALKMINGDALSDEDEQFLLEKLNF